MAPVVTLADALEVAPQTARRASPGRGSASPTDASVPRERLVRRLMGAGSGQLALLVAPAGYGKSALLAQWEARDGRPFAWVRLDAADNDPRAFLSAVALAVDAVEPIGCRPFEALASNAWRADALTLLCEALARASTPFVLVLDDAHSLEAPAARRIVAALWEALPAGTQLAVSSRTESVLPAARLQLQNAAVELRAEHLAATRSEARAMLRAAGIEADAAELDELVRVTEGWPAGILLAAQSLREQAQEGNGPVAFAPDDRLVARYVRQELLDGVAPDLAAFMRRTALLETVSALACDAILERDDSAEVLDRLSRSNALLRPLDRSGSAYRYHPLFAEALRAELRRLEPRAERALNLRASSWCDRNGDRTGAIRHAVHAGDPDQAGRLLWASAPTAGSAGEPDAREWLARFSHDQMTTSPLLGLAAAGSALAAGDLDESRRWTFLAAAARAKASRHRMRAEIDAGLMLMRAGTGRAGMTQMATDAAQAGDRLADGSAWRPLCRYLEGVSRQLGGDTRAARPLLEEGAYSAAVSAPMVQALCLSQLVLVEMDEGDAERADALALRARGQVDRCGLENLPPLTLVFAASALRHAFRGQTERAATDMRRALGLFDRIVDPSPWYALQCRILLARSALRLGGPADAGGLLDGAHRLLRGVSDAPTLERWVEAAREEVDAASGATAAADSDLTPAELRVLRYLPSHLSFREIAARLVVSPNTVKTHARGIYRKLDATSRATAVDRARRAGLVEPAARP